MIGFGLVAKYFITPKGRSLFYYLGFPTKTLRWLAVINLTTRLLSVLVRSGQRPCRMGGPADLPLPLLEKGGRQGARIPVSWLYHFLLHISSLFKHKTFVFYY